MRRPTLITLIVLFTLLVGATVWQLVLVNQDRPPYPAPSGVQVPSAAP